MLASGHGYFRISIGRVTPSPKNERFGLSLGLGASAVGAEPKSLPRNFMLGSVLRSKGNCSPRSCGTGGLMGVIARSGSAKPLIADKTNNPTTDATRNLTMPE